MNFFTAKKLNVKKLKWGKWVLLFILILIFTAALIAGGWNIISRRIEMDSSGKREQEKFQLLSEVVDKGYVYAAYKLGKCYEEGKSVEKNILTAIKYYRVAGNEIRDAAAALNKYKVDNAESLKNVEMIYTSGDDGANSSGRKPELKFVRDGKILLSLTAKVDDLCFMNEIFADSRYNLMRISFGPSLKSKTITDFRHQLLDLYGNGDFRFLLIGDHHHGNSSTGHLIHIIDVKNNFTKIAEISGGEIMDFAYYNKELIFDKDVINLGYFGIDGEAIVYIPVRYTADKEPEFIYKRVKMTGKSSEDLIQILRDRPRNYKETAITFLYAALIQSGNFKFAKYLAAKLDYPQEYIEKFHTKIIEEIRQSEYCDVIGKLNNVDFTKIK